MNCFCKVSFKVKIETRTRSKLKDVKSLITKLQNSKNNSKEKPLNKLQNPNSNEGTHS